MSDSISKWVQQVPAWHSDVKDTEPESPQHSRKQKRKVENNFMKADCKVEENLEEADLNRYKNESVEERFRDGLHDARGKTNTFAKKITGKDKEVSFEKTVEQINENGKSKRKPIDFKSKGRPTRKAKISDETPAAGTRQGER